jgi:hypothetical protein
VIGHHRREPRAVRHPGGLASLEVETIFLPCTSGLPGTGPAGDLDDLVHDAYSRQASETNNGGLDSQVSFLAGTYGIEGARSLLSGLRPAAARRAFAAGAGQRPPSAPGQKPCRLACCQARPAFTPAGG